MLFALVGTAAGQEHSRYIYTADFYIFDNPAVIKDLKLTSEQIVQIKVLKEELAKTIQAKGEELEDREELTLVGKEFAIIGKRYHDEKLRKVLTDLQYKRLAEISLQLAGNNALLNAETQKALGMTKEQTAAADDLAPKLMLHWQTGDKEAEAKALKQYADTLEQIGALLTPAQQQKFKAMKGVPMKPVPKG